MSLSSCRYQKFLTTSNIEGPLDKYMSSQYYNSMDSQTPEDTIAVELGSFTDCSSSTFQSFPRAHSPDVHFYPSSEASLNNSGSSPVESYSDSMVEVSCTTSYRQYRDCSKMVRQPLGIREKCSVAPYHKKMVTSQSNPKIQFSNADTPLESLISIVDSVEPLNFNESSGYVLEKSITSAFRTSTPNMVNLNFDVGTSHHGFVESSACESLKHDTFEEQISRSSSFSDCMYAGQSQQYYGYNNNNIDCNNYSSNYLYGPSYYSR